MPEYLAPGVYIEEVSFRSKSIEGVSTTTTGFIGPARFGPINMVPDILTSLGDYEAVYGDRQQLAYADGIMHNYLWHGVRAFFEEGGKRLYCMRVFMANSDVDTGIASADVPAGGGNNAIQVAARFPGAAGNMHVRFTLRMGQNVLGGDPVPPAPGQPVTPGQAITYTPKVGTLLNNDVVWINHAGNPAGGAFYLAERYFNAATRGWSWRFHLPEASPVSSPPIPLELADLTFSPNPQNTDVVRLITLAITVTPTERNAIPRVWADIPLDPAHERDGAPDSLTAQFSETPLDLNSARTLPIVAALGNNLTTGLDVLRALFDAGASATTPLQTALENLASLDTKTRANSNEVARSVDIVLSGGNDGQRPDASAYEGTAEEDSPFKTGLKAFEDIDEISIIAAPGSTFDYELGYRDNASTIMNLLIAHAELMRYRIAVLDSGDGQSIADVRAMRGRIDSSYAAFYYPWIRILDPVTRTEIFVPPSGSVAGIYARNDINRAVYKAPANEVVNVAIGFEHLLNKSQQDVLNPEGINCFRFFEGRGYRLWGARTASSDPEWKYVNLRRYFAYLEHSLDKGTQWAVFEPNGEALWANVRRTVSDFLLNEFQMGALLGDKPEQAFFVRCDRTTMTQNDLDNGRLVCLVGVAALRPAEYVIFRIGQWTASRSS
jgi:Bacteriophage tail sheath protein